MLLRGFNRLFSTVRTAVVFSGCGVYDGTECTEGVATLVALSRAGSEISCFAPNSEQLHVIDHTKGEPIEGDKRNTMVESARITRGEISPLSDLSVNNFDAIIFPGGFGAAKNLSDFGVVGPDMTVIPDVERVLKDAVAAKKAVGLCCISPILAAKVLGSQSGGSGATLTLGKVGDEFPYNGSIGAAESFGNTMQHKDVNEICEDNTNNIVTTPAYMKNAKPHEVFDGVAAMVDAVLARAKGETNQKLPKVAQLKPYKTTLEAGKKYFFCTCGLSTNQPFCSGAHKGTDMRPLKFELDEEKTAYLCGCKHSKTLPFCDGTHKTLAQN